MCVISDLKSPLIEWKLIIAIDGLNPKFDSKTHAKRYFSYVEKVKKIPRKEKIICENQEWGHLSGNLRNAFNKCASSRFVLVMQDDLMFISDVPLYEIMYTMNQDSNLKHVRFNRRQNKIGGLDTQLQEYKINGINFIKTNNWSDNNHIVKSDYYSKFVFPNLIGIETYPENELRILNDLNPERYGTYIYGEINCPNVIVHIGDVKSRTRAQMIKFESGNIILSIFIRFILKLHDYLRKMKI